MILNDVEYIENLQKKYCFNVVCVYFEFEIFTEKCLKRFENNFQWIKCAVISISMILVIV